MKTIKSRVWNKHRNAWDYSFVIDSNGALWFRTATGNEYCETMNRPSDGMMLDLEIAQFTGLVDCDGKEVYEGDVCAYNYIDNHRIDFTGTAYIIWDEINCGFSLVTIKDSRNDTRSQMSLFGVNTGNLRLKMIGNKFESPELLGVKND